MSHKKQLAAQRMEKVAYYLERHLDAEINVHLLSEIACYSEYHFHRVFRLYFGESVYACRKRLLLERSVRQLLHTDRNITDIAVRCGYDSPSAFNKAFKKHFACTPGHVRKRARDVAGNPPVPVPRRRFEMQADVVTLKKQKVIYARGAGRYADAAAEAWSKIMKFAYSNRLMNNEVRMFGISHDDPGVTDPDRIRYDACLDIAPQIELDDGLMHGALAAGKYVKLLHKGPYEQFSETYGFVFREWLPDSHYQLRDEPCFERYLNRDPRRTKPENLRTEVFIPIG